MTGIGAEQACHHVAGIELLDVIGLAFHQHASIGAILRLGHEGDHDANDEYRHKGLNQYSFAPLQHVQILA